MLFSTTMNDPRSRPILIAAFFAVRPLIDHAIKEFTLPLRHEDVIRQQAKEKNLEAFLSADVAGTKVVVGDGPALETLRARYPDVLFLGALAGEGEILGQVRDAFEVGSAGPLLDLGWLPWRVEVVHRAQVFLHIHTDTKRVGVSDDEADRPGVHLVSDSLAPLLAHAAIDEEEMGLTDFIRYVLRWALDILKNKRWRTW